MADSRLLSTAETAHRLGVTRETVYAYVSRGRLRRHPSSTRRRSRFDADEVDRVAGRARHPGRSGALEVVIETELTALDPAGRLAYRGRDACDLARFRRLEDVAGLLWDGDAHTPWTLAGADAQLIAALRPAVDATAGGTSADLVTLAVAALAAANPARADLSPGAVRRAGARMLAAALAVLAPGAGRALTPAAARLWPAIVADGRAPRPVEIGALDAALVLLADHELAPSTLAARVAASTRSDPYHAVACGLGALAGPLHGGAATACEALVRDAARLGAPTALGGWSRSDAAPAPGFGHRVYRDRDPRADHLLGRLSAVAVDPRRPRVVAETLRHAGALGWPAPNVDLALAALSWTMDLRPGASRIVFTVARIVGLVAHALEEYRHTLRFRPRATYVGPAPRW